MEIDTNKWVEFLKNHYQDKVWCDDISCNYQQRFFIGDKCIARVGYNGFMELEDSVAEALELSRGDYQTMIFENNKDLFNKRNFEKELEKLREELQVLKAENEDQKKVIDELFKRSKIVMYYPDCIRYPVEHMTPFKDNKDLILSELKQFLCE